MKILLYLSIPLFLLACSDVATVKSKNNSSRKENVDGGPCSYRHDTLPAIILGILPTGDEIFEIDAIRCATGPEDSVYCDTISYYLENGGYARGEEIKKQSLKVGDTICYIEQHMISGSCKPFLAVLKLGKYMKKR